MSYWKETEIGKIPNDWQIKTVDEIKSKEPKSIISGPFGSNISSKYFVPMGIPVIRGNNLSLTVGNKFFDNGFVFITEEKANELGTWAWKDDLIFTAAGTIGQIGILNGKEKYKKYIISNKQLRVRLDKSIIEPLFAYYWFASPQMVDTINQRDTGSTIPLINLTVLKGLKVPLPNLPVQRAIAGVLSSLDDKIDLLQRQNKTLEAMAEALWRKMFVDEADPKWKMGKLGDISDINPNRVIKKGKVASYLDMSNMPTTGPFPKEWIHREYTSGMKFKNGDTLIARITPCLENGKTAYVNFLVDGEIGWGSTEYIVITSMPGYSSVWFYFLARYSDFRDYAIQNMTGTSGRQRVSGDSIAQYEIAIPPVKLFDMFDKFTEPVMVHIMHNSFQIRKLSLLRDTLLPKLMSGEVKVYD